MATTFDSSWRRAYLEQLRKLLPRGGPGELDLLTLDETLAALGHDGETDLGLQEVEVDAIVGTVARAGDFDRHLHPRRPHLRDRWEALARTERDLPPVHLVRLNDFYFVQDGHHRVSIARARGVQEIQAHVRRIRTIVCANRCLTLADLPSKAAQRSFLERVPLPDDVRVGLTLDKPSDWRRLADAAEAWGFRQGLEGRHLAGRCELAEAWWAEEVLPLVERLECRGVGVDEIDLQALVDGMDTAQLREQSQRLPGTPREGGTTCDPPVTILATAVRPCVTMSHMESIGVRELRREASRWLARVRAGEAFVITDRGKPIARLVPLTDLEGYDALVAEGQLIPGSGRSLDDMLDDLDAEIPAEADVSLSAALLDLRAAER